MITIGIVDDDPLVRSALTSLLGAEEDIEVLFECSNGREAVTACGQRAPDVLLMDIRMPELDGISATVAVRQAAPATRVILITVGDVADDVAESLAAGASGFLLKTEPPDVLADAIRTVHRGSAVMSPGPVARWARASTTRPIVPDSEEPLTEPLTSREQQVLRLLCDAYSNAEIADTLGITEATVKAHVSSIMTKLDVSSRLKAVVRALRLGLVGPAGD